MMDIQPASAKTALFHGNNPVGGTENTTERSNIIAGLRPAHRLVFDHVAGLEGGGGTWDIAQACGVPRSSADDMLQSLARKGLIAQIPWRGNKCRWSLPCHVDSILATGEGRTLRERVFDFLQERGAEPSNSRQLTNACATEIDQMRKLLSEMTLAGEIYRNNDNFPTLYLLPAFAPEGWKPPVPQAEIAAAALLEPVEIPVKAARCGCGHYFRPVATETDCQPCRSRRRMSFTSMVTA